MKKSRSIILATWLFTGGGFAQEPVDRLKAGSDKAQEVFDRSAGKPAPKDTVLFEEMPKYPGGEAALYTFLRKETKYPEEARKEGITGKVFVEFIVEKDGSVDSVRVKRGAHPLLDAEAVRVVSLTGGWTPGTQRGKPVRLHYMLPISFTMHADDLERIRQKQAKRAGKGK